MLEKAVKILLVEDNPAEARLLQEFLKGSQFPFEVTHVKRLGAALQQLSEKAFDVLLLDLTLPDSQGLAALEPLNREVPGLPIVVLTNTDDAVLALEAMRLGAQDYLVKRQVNTELLVRSLRYAMERKQASEALRQANEALEGRVQERTAELVKANALLIQEIGERQKAQEELERSNADLEQFAYIASHDLQSPLGTVNSYAQLLARRYRGKLDTRADKYIGYIVDNTQLMGQLIQDLLTYSRLGQTKQATELVDCEAVLKSVLVQLKAAIATHKANITHDPLPKVVVDSVQLGQLLQNLLGNAIKYRSEDPPEIHVSARLNSELPEGSDRLEQAPGDLEQNYQRVEWIFSVRDNGIGIDPKHFEQIFLIFQRLHTDEEYPGTGIGLALCQKIVEHHGGRLWVDSQPGCGATFHFTLPAQETT